MQTASTRQLETTNGPHEIKRLLPRHFKMLELKLAGLGNKEIAEALGVTPQNVYAVSRSPIFNAEYQRQLEAQNTDSLRQVVTDTEEKVKQILLDNAESAATTQATLLDSPDESVRLRASNSILDRVIGKPQDKSGQPGMGVSINIETEQANLLVTALKESSNGRKISIPDQKAARTSEDEQGDVYQAPGEGSCDGPVQAQEQAQGAVTASRFLAVPSHLQPDGLATAPQPDMESASNG